MIVKLLTEHHLEFLSLKGGYRRSSEYTLVKCHIAGNHMSRLKYSKRINISKGLNLNNVGRNNIRNKFRKKRENKIHVCHSGVIPERIFF